jgi:hypothetical protein
MGKEQGMLLTGHVFLTSEFGCLMTFWPELIEQPWR